MKRDLKEYDRRAARALTKEGKHAEYFKQLLDQENYCMHTPITPLYIKDIGNSFIIAMSEEVFGTLCEIRRYSYKYNVEVPFFLFGMEYKGRATYFHTAEYTTTDLEHSHSKFDTFAEPISRLMLDYLNENNAANSLPFYNGDKNDRYKKAVRCYGHTHPPGGGDRFSFADVACTVEHSLINEYFASGEMSSLDVIMTPSGDINFIRYESNLLMECFMKYRRVYVRKENGEFVQLNAYVNGHYDPYPIS